MDKKTYTVFYKDFGSDLYRPVFVVIANGLEDAYWKMQGENWSPHGEAKPLLDLLGVKHTSMMVGDAFYSPETGTYYIVEDVGFSEVDSINTIDSNRN